MGPPLKRKMDKHGRIAIPVEYRRRLLLNEPDVVAIRLDTPYIILAKYQPECCICEAQQSLYRFRGQHVCVQCRGQIAGLLDKETL